MRISVNAHDAGAFRQGVVGPPEVFSHGIFTVNIIMFPFGVIAAVIGLALLDIRLGEAVLLRILLARPLPVRTDNAGPSTSSNEPTSVPWNTVSGQFSLMLWQKIQGGLGVALGPLYILVDLVQNGVVLGLHPLVQILGHKIGVLDKEMAHPFFVVVVVPELKFFLVDHRDGMELPIQIDLPFLRAAGRGGTAKAGQHQKQNTE